MIEEVLKSSEIEGELLDKDKARSSLARRLGVDIGALTPAERNVEGVVEMMLDATRESVLIPTLCGTGCKLNWCEPTRLIARGVLGWPLTTVVGDRDGGFGLEAYGHLM